MLFFEQVILQQNELGTWSLECLPILSAPFDFLVPPLLHIPLLRFNDNEKWVWLVLKYVHKTELTCRIPWARYLKCLSTNCSTRALLGVTEIIGMWIPVTWILSSCWNCASQHMRLKKKKIGNLLRPTDLVFP